MINYNNGYDENGLPTQDELNRRREEAQKGLGAAINDTEYGEEVEPIAGMAGMDPMMNMAMQIKGAIDSLPDWYSIEHKNEDPTAVRAIYGSSTGSPGLRFLQGHSADMAAARQNIEANAQDYSNVKNNANLLNAWDSNSLQGNINYNFGWSNVADIYTNSIKEPLGGVTTMLSQIGGKTRAEKLNNAVNRANTATINSFYNTAKNNSARSQRDALMHYAAFGGPLSQLNSFYSNNGVEKFNVGGSHEQNPNDGIQQGIAPDGYPNLVEEGEVKYKDYIYSKRIKPTKTLLKKNNLPEKYHGLSYAEIAEKLQKESEMRPNDPVSISTLNSWMGRLQSAQEETKAINEARRAAKFVDSLSDQDKMGLLAMMQQQSGQEIPQEAMPQQEPMMMADGGQIYIKPENRGKFTELKERTGYSATWFKEHGTPAQKKMATFALNAKHWDHSKDNGGHLFDGTRNSHLTIGPRYSQVNPISLEEAMVPQLYRYLKEQGLDDHSIRNIINSDWTAQTLRDLGINDQIISLIPENEFNYLVKHNGALSLGQNIPQSELFSKDTPSREAKAAQDYEDLAKILDTIDTKNIQRMPVRTAADAFQSMQPSQDNSFSELGIHPREWDYTINQAYRSSGTPFLRLGTTGMTADESLRVPPSKYEDWANFRHAGIFDYDEDGNLKDYSESYRKWVKGLTEDDFRYLQTLPGWDASIHPDLATYKKRSLDKKYRDTHAFNASLRRNPTTTDKYQIMTVDDKGNPVYQTVTGDDIKKYDWSKFGDLDETDTDEWGNRIITHTFDNSNVTLPESKPESKPGEKKKGKAEKKGFDWDKLQGIGDIGLILSSVFGPDYRYANQLRQLAGQYNPVAAPSLGGYRKYTPYDVNLGDAENLAMQAAALRANAGQNRATQAAQDLAVLNQYQKAAAARNLEWQKANEANRLATDTYNLGIDEKNLAMIQAYDRLNSNIKDKRLDMLARGAKAEDDASTLWSQGLSTSVTNFLDNMDARRKERFANDMYEKYLAQHAPVKFMLQND